MSKCDNADIAVAPSFTVPPCGEGKLTVTYFPLVMRPQEVVARLTLSCPELGDFPYVLKLCTTHAGADKFIRFQCPLGSSQTQTLRLTHFAKANADFVCKFVDPKPTTFVKTNGQYAIKCPPAGPDGAEVSFDVTFEPSKIGDVKETLSVASPVAGEYTFSLAGSCLPPERQGPVDIKSGSNAQVPLPPPSRTLIEWHLIPPPPPPVMYYNPLDPPPPAMYWNGRTPQEKGGYPPPLLPFQCLRLTAKISLRRLRCHADLSFKLVLARLRRGPQGDPRRRGGPSQTLPPPPLFRPHPPPPLPLPATAQAVGPPCPPQTHGPPSPSHTLGGVVQGVSSGTSIFFR